MIPIIHLELQGDGVWPDLAEKPVHDVHEISFAVLAAGMESGLPSVSIRLDLPDGSVVIAQTSLRALLTAADAIVAAYGDPR